MLRFILALVAALVLFWAAPRAQAEEIKMSESLAQYLALADFSVQSGRIVITTNYVGRSITSNASGPGPQRNEQLSINASSRFPTIKYENNSPQFHLIVEISGGDRFELRLTPQRDSTGRLVEFDQITDEDLRLTVGDSKQRRTLRARGLWQLLIAEPELCRAELVPLLELVQPDWRLMDTAEEVERALVKWARTHAEHDPYPWEQLIAKLGSPKYAERRAADRALRLAGERVAPWLESLDLSRLDAEQRSRIRAMLAELDVEGGDTPQRTAVRLSGDRAVWLALLARPDAVRRRLAAEQLEKLLQKPIEFDPAADEPTRAAQLERLRTALDSRE